MPCYSTATWMPNYDKFHNVDSKTDLQGAPIPWEKFITSVTVTDFFTKFTAFTEKDSCHIRSTYFVTIIAMVSKLEMSGKA